MSVHGHLKNTGSFNCMRTSLQRACKECREFSLKMETLGYLPTELHEMRTIKTDGGVVIYHLALFSKSTVAKRFWQQASTYSQPQRNLF
jgi:hypothetical protein